MSLPPAQWRVLGAFVVVAVALAGWGTLFRRVCGARVRSGDDLASACLEGWAFLLVALQLWHFALPVDDVAAVAALVVGAAGLVLVDRGTWSALARGAVRNVPAVVVTIAAWVWLSQLALGGPRHGDAGDVYIPTTLWMRAYPVVVGLGNLHAPYAYNESYFLWSALTSFGPFAARPYHVVNAALLAVMTARGVLGFWRAIARRLVRWSDLYWMLLVPGEFALALSIFLTSPSPDVGIFVVGAAAFASVLEVATGGADHATYHLLAVVLFAVAGWTIKISFAGMTAALLVVVPLGWWWRVRPRGRTLARVAASAAVIAALAVVPWLAANVLMSGSPFFPSAVGTLDVPWRVHRDVQSWIESDKYMGPVATMWTQPSWVWQRLANLGWNAPEVVLPLAIGAGGIVLAALLAIVRVLRRAAPGDRVAWWVVLPPLVSLAFAVRLTPMPRYAGATMWLIGVGATLVACGAALRRSVVARVAAAAATVAMSVWLASEAPVRWPGYTGFETAPAPPTDATALASGLVVNVPRGGASCYTAPLPCAPPPDPRLALRHPGDLAGGFELDLSIPAPIGEHATGK